MPAQELQRQQAKVTRDFATADQLRETLRALNVDVDELNGQILKILE